MDLEARVDRGRPPASSYGCDAVAATPGIPQALSRAPAWTGALVVVMITVILLLLDISGGPVHRYWSRHSFTSSVVSGLLVLLLTVLIVDRVARKRQLRRRSRAVAAQAAIIVAQADRTVDATKSTSRTAAGRDAAADELRTYTQMLLTSAPLLIDARPSRTFLEAAQHVAAEVFWTLRDGVGDDVPETRVDVAVNNLRIVADPILTALSRQERAALSPDGDSDHEVLAKYDLATEGSGTGGVRK